MIDETLHLPFKIPIIAFADNCSIIESTKQVDDTDLRIEISAIKELIFKNDIESIKWSLGAPQLASLLTKRGAQSSLLLHTIQKGRITF